MSSCWLTLVVHSCSNLLLLGLQQDPESGQQRCHRLSLQGQTVLKNMELLIQNTYQVVSLMQAGRFTETLKQIDASKHQLDLDFEVAYCHYRLNDPRKALSVLEGVANPQVRFMISFLYHCVFCFTFSKFTPRSSTATWRPRCCIDWKSSNNAMEYTRTL